MKSKKILFFLPSFAGGGAEKVTITFINNIPLENISSSCCFEWKRQIKKIIK